jgi:hypothetical protein
MTYNDNGTGTIEIEATVNEKRYTTAAHTMSTAGPIHPSTKYWWLNVSLSLQDISFLFFGNDVESKI